MISIKGSGMVQIKMHNGMVKKLDYWIILELRKNLISLATLVKDGMKYSGEGDGVRVPMVLLWL